MCLALGRAPLYPVPMPKTVAQKLGIKPGERILVLDPPDGFAEALGSLPEDVQLHSKLDGPFDFVQCFASTKAKLRKLLPALKSHLSKGGRLWVGYPKGTSKNYDSEINRDSIWSYAKTIGMEAVSLIAVDDDWSSMRLKVVED
jgi:hypothetical protein